MKLDTLYSQITPIVPEVEIVEPTVLIPTKLIARTAVMCLVVAPSVAMAELRSEMQAYIVTTDATGVEQYFAADSVKPGQTIEYRMQHTNGFDNAIGGVAVVGPVPEGSELIVGRSSSDVSATFEVRGEFDPDREGEEWSTLPAQRITVQADGTRLIETAKPEHFTAVRWSLGDAMQQDASVNHAYRVQVK
jgi:hypothetical protein